jgi:hypothetical protein
LNDIYLYFNATKSDRQTDKNFTEYILSLKKNDYAVDVSITTFNATSNSSTTINACKFLVYGQNTSIETRYLLGNAFLRSYYVMLNYTDDTLGFNGDYTLVVRNPNDPGNDKKFKPDTEGMNTLTVILIIAGAVLVAALGVCLYIKKRNEKINNELTSNAKYHSIDQ